MSGGELTGEYRWSPALTLRTTLRYEHFDADDWQLDGVEPATVPTLLSLGADAYDYDVTLFELAFTSTATCAPRSRTRFRKSRRVRSSSSTCWA